MIPGTTISSSEGERIAVLGRNTTSTTVAVYSGVLAANISSTIVAANIGALGGTAVAIPIKISSGLGDVTHLMNITQSISSRNFISTAAASANGVTVNVANNVGYLRVKVLGATGLARNRYILLFAT
jgi:hypothetical protein